MRILVIGLTVWSNENNSGNTLSNIFGNLDAEFAHIYCSGGKPSNNICKEYYQITDKMILDYIIKRKKIGSKIENVCSDSENTNFEKQARRFNNSITKILRDLAWCLSKIDTDEFYSFIDNFNPDIIFAPCYANFRMQKLIRKVSKKIKIPIIGYVSDDIYAYKRGMNFIDLVYQFFLRKSIKKSFEIYEYVYTMTEEQKEEYERIFDIPMKILRKSAVQFPSLRVPNHIMRIIFGGGTYFGRVNTLVSVAKAVKVMNQDAKRFEFHIYTSNEITKSNLAYLNDAKNSFVHSSINYIDLIKEYEKSDIALHVESFDKKQSDYFKLSFSTKIVDCLQSGCVTLAICPNDNSGYRYLVRENAAVCIDNDKHIEESLSLICNKFAYYQRKAYNCLEKNHNPHVNSKMIKDDFDKLINTKESLQR